MEKEKEKTKQVRAQARADVGVEKEKTKQEIEKTKQMEATRNQITATMEVYGKDGRLTARQSITGDAEVCNIPLFHEFILKYIRDLISKLLQVIIEIMFKYATKQNKLPATPKLHFSSVSEFLRMQFLE